MLTKPQPLSNSRAFWRDEIAHAYGDSVAAIFETGRKLIAARSALVFNKGEFGKLIRDELPFGRTHAARYLKIAECNALSLYPDTGKLPYSIMVLAVLAGLPDDVLERALSDGTIHPEMTEKDARAIKPLTPDFVAEDEQTTGIALEQWNAMDADEQSAALKSVDKKARFTKQTTTGIEWAQSSWNPITGCLHDCPYCYARDIAERFTGKAFPHGFAPTLWPARLDAPSRTNVPAEAEADIRFRNVFACSMADLFGRWVPETWIESILDRMNDNPQWNFLCLTKFPKRMAEFDIPANAWMGTTVDLQARVKNAETAFARLAGRPGIRWLSIEPMLEPLKFERLDLFDWVVIGGASRSTQTPEFKPPFEWIVDLVAQAREAGTRVYFKTNLLGNRLLEMPFDAPIVADPSEAPEVFRYLGKARA